MKITITIAFAVAVGLQYVGAQSVTTEASNVTDTATASSNVTMEASNATTVALNTTTVPTNETSEALEESHIEAITSKFDCRREGHDCSIDGGHCDLDLGTCQCYANYSGFNCETNTANLESDEAKCNSGKGCVGDNATCSKDEASAYSCDCPYHLYGDSCEKARFQLECLASSMALTITPFSAQKFTGAVYVVSLVNNSKVEDADCLFKDNDGTMTLNVTYDHIISKCGGQALNNNTSHEVKFIIQSHSVWLTMFDQAITARCDVNVSSEIRKTVIVNVSPDNATVSEIEVSSDLPETMGERFSGSAAGDPQVMPHNASMTVLQHGNATGWAPISGKVKVGEKIAFRIDNQDTSYYTSMRVESCKLVMGDQQPLALIDGQCPASRLAWSLMFWKDTERTNTSTTIKMLLPSILMTEKPKTIAIDCFIKLCAADAAAECEVTEGKCNSTSGFMAESNKVVNYGRKRRNADSTEMASVSSSFRMDYGDEGQSSAQSSSQTSGSQALAPISILVFILSTLMLKMAC